MGRRPKSPADRLRLVGARSDQVSQTKVGSSGTSRALGSGSAAGWAFKVERGYVADTPAVGTTLSSDRSLVHSLRLWDIASGQVRFDQSPGRV